MPNVSILGSYGDLSASQVAGSVSSLVPSGVIMPYAGSTAPAGWLICDGSSVSQTTYPDLYAAIGFNWGNPGGGSFNLPSLAGQFLRGRANGSANDPDRATRTASAAGGNTGDAVGSVQGNATAKNNLSAATNGTDGTHTHTVSAMSTFATQGLAGGSTWNATNGASTLTTTNTGSGHGHTITITGDNETRPRNAYVNYIIKV